MAPEIACQQNARIPIKIAEVYYGQCLHYYSKLLDKEEK